MDMQASFLGLGGFSFSTMGSGAPAAAPAAAAPVQAADSLSPFPGMSVHRRPAAPNPRGPIGQVGHHCWTLSGSSRLCNGEVDVWRSVVVPCFR